MNHSRKLAKFLCCKSKLKKTVGKFCEDLVYINNQRRNASSSQAKLFYELRTYTLKPELQARYLQETGKNSELRKNLNPGWLG